MLRTAEEILNANYYHRSDPEVDFDSLVDIINTARREALEEAARRATVINNCSVWNCEGESVNRQSILNLIKELK